MRIRIFILSFLIVILISATSCADNSQFHKPEYEKQLEQQKPVFVSSSMWAAIGYTCVDVDESYVIVTDNYIHYQNPNNKHAAVFHKTKTMLFIRIGDANVRAYFIIGMNLTRQNEWWSVYEIRIQEEENLYTKMYKEMVDELQAVADGCLRKKDDYI